MAGPAASVIAQFDCSVPTWRELMVPYASCWHDRDSCGVADTRPFGGRYHGEARPFVGSVDPFRFDAEQFPDDAALSDAVRKFMNRDFTNSVVVAAMCNQQCDHQILCEVLIHLAIRLDGVVDFDCLDAPADGGLQRCEWLIDGQVEWTTIGNPEAARMWMRHPAFHMIK